jgi:hypothetical protein
MILTKSIEIAESNIGPMAWDEAVKACKALGDGWRLPTKEELDWMYQHKDEIGGFGSGWLWSSSQDYNGSGAWIQRFSVGYQDYYYKFSGYAVRACRDVEAKQEEPFDINRLGKTAYVSRLRDKFAGQALAGIAGEGTYRSSEPQVMAQHAYRFADAMLAERAKEPKNAAPEFRN